MSPHKRIRLGMVGGGKNAFIGAVHRIASRIDDQYDLVAGALSSTPETALASGRELGLAADRNYPDFETMAKKEAARADGIEAVAIVTPNHVHFAPAKAFLEKNVHVICDKPLTSTLADARALRDVVRRSKAEFLLTHNYTGYPLMRQARALVASGALGAIRVVQAEYPQEWLAQPLENSGQKQAGWRTDPARSGMGGCVGDIGTHAYNLLRFVTGLKTEALCADLHTFVAGRQVDDNVHILLRFEGGARGMLWASQVAPGHENGLMLRIYGEKAGLEWVQAEPNKMWFCPLGQPRQLLTRGGAITTAGEGAAGAGVRIPAGHPEGYLEAFATLYTEFAQVIRTGKGGEMLPDVDDGVEGLEFIVAAVVSSRNNSQWTVLGEA
ncbi:MAG: Gfo/Idh/MocA family oxidoreductase [Alphaproteobacteria bacterium]|nr:Gfo/Idh/MocA family oxidoreductase [Alphaproteobacteria bacterium]